MRRCSRTRLLRVLLGVLAATLLMAACGDDTDGGPAEATPEDTTADDSDDASAATDDCAGIATEGPAWTAEASGAEEETFDVEGRAAGFHGNDGVAGSVGRITLNDRGRAEVILRVPGELLADGGTFHLGEPLEGAPVNAVLLAEYEAPVSGQVVVCPSGGRVISGAFEVTATSVTDGSEVTVDGTFSGLVPAG